MRDRLRRALLAATALGGIVAASPALAQIETDTAQDVNPADQARAASQPIAPGTIIVTARRFEERLQDVPISITVFNQEQLSNRNIVNPSELATYTPSLGVNRQYGSEKSSFTIRGFVQELGTQPSVAVYFADVVAPRAQGPTPSGNGTLPGTLFDLQSVQVLKGPQGTLFGRNTTGGAILLVPQKPKDVFEGYIEGTVGNYNARRVQAVVNAPLGDIGAFRLGFDKMTRDGYLRNRSGIGPDDFADVDYYAVRASLVLNLADDIENYTIATYNDSNTHGQLPRLIACARNQAAQTVTQILSSPGCAQIDRQNARGDGFYDVENNIPDPQVHLRQLQVINTTTWDVSDTLTIKNIVSYAEFREASRINLVGDRLFVTNPFTIRLPPTSGGGLFPINPGPFLTGLPFNLAAIEPGPSGDNAAQYTITEELQFQGRSADERLTWQAGGYLEISRPLKSGTQFSSLIADCTNAAAFQCTTPVAPLMLGGSLSVIDQRYKFRNYSAYAQATYDITEQFAITGGIRYTSDRTSARSDNAIVRFPPGGAPQINCTESLAPLTSLDQRSICRKAFVEKSSKPTWLINLDYKPDDDILLYAKYARGYRQGTVNLLPIGSELVLTGPEKVDSYELGAKLSFDGPVPGNLNVAAFYNDFSDQQVQANTIPRVNSGVFPVNVLVNAGKSRIQGIEVEASVRPVEGLQIDLGYAYLDTKLQEIDFPVIPATSVYEGLSTTAAEGSDLVFSPKNRLTVTANYRLPLEEEGLGRVSLGATFTHTGKQVSTYADAPFVNSLGFDPGRLPSTDLLNLNVNWDSVGGHPVDLSLFATNVTKEKYRVAVFQTGQVGFDSALLGEPRIFGARLRYRFGDLAE